MSPRIHRGVLCPINRPSEHAPHGCRRHRISLQRSAAIGIARSAHGKPLVVNHDEERIIGAVTAAHTDAKRVYFECVAFGPLPSNQVSIGAHGEVATIHSNIYELDVATLRHVSVILPGQAPAFADACID